MTTNALAVDQFWQPTEITDWYENVGPDGASNNWDGLNENFVPSAEFDEVAVVNNGGTAFIAIQPNGTASQPFAGGLVLGRGGSGSVEVRSGGRLQTADCADNTICNGAIAVGVNSFGQLTVLPGGSVIAPSLSLGGAANSSLNLGGLGSGVSVQIAGNANLNRITRVTGPNVNFTADSVALGGASTLVAEITSASQHSPLVGSTSANLQGALEVQFADGITPAFGSTWTLVDAPTIQGSFSSIDTSAAPELGPGLAYQVRQTAGGLGSQVQLAVNGLLTLAVDWDSREVSIRNQSPTSIAIDGYSVVSPMGSLDNSPGTWNSLAESSLPGWDEAASSRNSVNELRQSGSSSLSNGFDQSLGSIFDPVFDSFQSAPSDLTFEYRQADGSIVEGLVVYEGTSIENNLRLTVDPSTGRGQLKNDSPFTVAIDGYSVLSESGALLPGSWDGIGVADWESASPTATALSELLPTIGETLSLSPGQAFDLGVLFNTSGDRDLALEFRTTDGPLDGVVTYGAIPPVLAGDFNSNGVVDAADYTVWRDGLGTIYTQDDYNTWRDNFGATSSTATAVPEPATLLLTGFVLLALTQHRPTSLTAAPKS